MVKLIYIAQVYYLSRGIYDEDTDVCAGCGIIFASSEIMFHSSGCHMCRRGMLAIHIYSGISITNYRHQGTK